MKILVCGSRGFNDYDQLASKLDDFLYTHDLSKIELVSGGARGADTLAERYASEKGIKFTRFDADWEQHGRSAGYIRNGVMAEYCAGPENQCIAFWDGKSLGTKHMIHAATKSRMTVVKVPFVI